MIDSPLAFLWAQIIDAILDGERETAEGLAAAIEVAAANRAEPLLVDRMVDLVDEHYGPSIAAHLREHWSSPR